MLGDLHKVIVVRVSHVEFAGGELGIMGHVNTFVTKLAANLVHAVNASHYQGLWWGEGLSKGSKMVCGGGRGLVKVVTGFVVRRGA